MVKRIARKAEMPDYQPRDNAHVQGSKWDDWDDAGFPVKQINERDYGIESVDRILDDLQR